MQKNWEKGDFMPRIKREVSETGIYHVMSRGNARNSIFIDNQDKGKYIAILREKMGKSNFSLYAYCIMDNHSHLIIKENDMTLRDIMKSINISYASYFNKKYDRVGHVFQDRYLSEPILDDKYLLAVVRYIHNNPVKAKLVQRCEEYQWSSYINYIENNDSDIVNTEFVLSLFSKDISERRKLFKAFSQKPNDDKFIDIMEAKEDLKRYKDAEIYIKEFLYLNKLKLEDLKRHKAIDKRNELILNLRTIYGLSIRDTANLLKIGRNMVANVK